VTISTLPRLAAPVVRERALGLLSALLTALALLPYLLGAVAGAVAEVAAWAWSGLVVGWSDGRNLIRKGRDRS
jgi:hypothetical protein